MDAIRKKALQLIREYGTNDPLKIVRKMDVILKYAPLESLGAVGYIQRHYIIILNDSLDEKTTEIVLAHELGHIKLHSDWIKKSTHTEMEMFNMVDRTEYEANAFAANLLLEKDEIINMCNSGYTVAQISAFTGYDPNLILIFFNELGITPPLDIDARFLKNGQSVCKS